MKMWKCENAFATAFCFAKKLLRKSSFSPTLCAKSAAQSPLHSILRTGLSPWPSVHWEKIIKLPLSRKKIE
jgi:hypothetical protein